jgi:hypothetical protein
MLSNNTINALKTKNIEKNKIKNLDLTLIKKINFKFF